MRSFLSGFLLSFLLLGFSDGAMAAPRVCFETFPTLAPPLPVSTFSSKEIEKYNTPTVLKFKFTDQSLDNVQAMYHHLPVPLIVENILRMKDVDSSRLINESTGYFSWNKTQDTFMTVNPTYTQAGTVLEALQNGTVKNLKDGKHGIALITWYVHPALLRQEVVRQKNNKSSEEAVQQKISSLEKTGTRYLVSILDLRKSDVAYLKDLKKMSLDYLERNFGAIPGKDQIRLDFHFPYSIKTSTLHLHARVNMPAHPLELTKSYGIDDVIAYLEGGKSMKEMILDRQQQLGAFYFPNETRAVLEAIGGQHLEEVPNPFLSSLEANNCTQPGCSP
jgi:hypothetical protein